MIAHDWPTKNYTFHTISHGLLANFNLLYMHQIVNLNYKMLVAYHILKLHHKKLHITFLQTYTLILKKILIQQIITVLDIPLLMASPSPPLNFSGGQSWIAILMGKEMARNCYNIYIEKCLFR